MNEIDQYTESVVSALDDIMSLMYPADMDLNQFQLF